ncbi:hypothetical protein O4H53_26025 [Sulfitobacter sp. G21635-S1]|uniref:hypothetical protein n=1 Tax=Sulfitobacter sp. G21635-S1 TaxID=3014043 RepID=UPI0022AEF299|nr:hypothetical protein [Sulfitobacter sp. G21635-S1]MCZ4259013.1 hypothetical protein [Sulfitobacter sp. G21635-S1]
MSVPLWPTDLPKPQREGFQTQIVDPRLRRVGETGPPAYRRRWSSVAETVGLSIDVTRNQKALFDDFFKHVTAFGSLPFYMPDPLTDGWPMLDHAGTPLLTAGGQPLLLSARWLCLFGDETPAQTIRGVRFIIAFTVAVMP